MARATGPPPTMPMGKDRGRGRKSGRSVKCVRVRIENVLRHLPHMQTAENGSITLKDPDLHSAGSEMLPLPRGPP
jgi:hypothetical protein